MKKNTAKILMAVLCLMMAIGIATGSTFAWFSMNNKVLVTGMTVTTKVNNDLLIAPADASDDTYNGNQEANYLISLNQTREGTLEPASTIDGVNFWYTATSNVQATGDAKADQYTAYSEDTAISHAAAAKTQYDDDFNGNYGFTSPVAGYNTVAYAYIDYSFYLKGTNADNVARKIFMDKCNLLYNGAAPTDKAYRVAVFALESATETKTVTEVAVGNLKTILAPASATYFTSGKAISANAAPSVAVTNLGARAVIAEVDPTSTVYYKVTVRLWLEGEDTTCNNDTYATLTGDWTLDLSFTLGDAGVSDGNAVNQIGGVAVATLSAPANIATAALSVSGETAASYAFYKADGTAISNGVDDFSISGSALTNNGAERDVYCIITTAKGNTYRTPTITLDAPTP